jgi:hypothetical protein
MDYPIRIFRPSNRINEHDAKHLDAIRASTAHSVEILKANPPLARSQDSRTIPKGARVDGPPLILGKCASLHPNALPMTMDESPAKSSYRSLELLCRLQAKLSATPDTRNELERMALEYKQLADSQEHQEAEPNE